MQKTCTKPGAMVEHHCSRECHSKVGKTLDNVQRKLCNYTSGSQPLHWITQVLQGMNQVFREFFYPYGNIALFINIKQIILIF